MRRGAMPSPPPSPAARPRDDGSGHGGAARAVSLVAATAAALCAGSIAAFSLYAPAFQARLGYSQLQVNGVAIGGSLALYLPISAMGYACDRRGPAPLALASSVLFGLGYGLAAAVYRRVDKGRRAGRGAAPADPAADWSYPLVVTAFVCVGAATCAMYMASVSTCAKNFSRARYRGLALAMPVTGFGLSGMWLSQVGSRFFCELRPGGARDDVDVFRFFVFLAVLLFVVGIVASVTLRVVDERHLILDAIEDLERSALLGHAEPPPPSGPETDPLFQPSKDWLLNAETRRFLADGTMWPFALAFLLMIGPGEAFVNNLGTVLGTLTPPASTPPTSAATQVSIFGVASTVSRLLLGSLTDLVAPVPESQRAHSGGSSRGRVAVSRVVFVLFFAALMSVGLAFLASGAVQDHAERFWVVSGLVGAGYGAIFSLTPLVVSIIWCAENFATNFGIIAMLPALGSTFWGLVYSAVYQAGAKVSSSAGPLVDQNFCYGLQCYSSAFWAEAISVWAACALLFWVWKGQSGWQRRGIIV